MLSLQQISLMLAQAVITANFKLYGVSKLRNAIMYSAIHRKDVE